MIRKQDEGEAGRSWQAPFWSLADRSTNTAIATPIKLIVDFPSTDLPRARMATRY